VFDIQIIKRTTALIVKANIFFRRHKVQPILCSKRTTLLFDRPRPSFSLSPWVKGKLVDILRKCFPKKPWFLGVKPFTSALRAWADAQVTLCDDKPFAYGLFLPPLSWGVFRPGLDHPPGCGEGDLDISIPGVPGIEGRWPRERPCRPLVVPSLLCDSMISGRYRFGGCLAADERLLRWPAEAEKED
jgi:hypothetical protein